jgi:hypothetical protein
MMIGTVFVALAAASVAGAAGVTSMSGFEFASSAASSGKVALSPFAVL